MNFTIQDFTAIDKRLSAVEPYLPFINEYLPEFGINTVNRVASFLGQCVHECDYFQGIEEYATGAAYEGRKDLGNIAFGDGKRFKGRGLIHTTGRANYASFSAYVKHNLGDNADFMQTPELLNLPKYAVLSGVFYWHSHSLNEYADKENFAQMTKIINGGLTNYPDRLATISKMLLLCRNKILS